MTGIRIVCVGRVKEKYFENGIAAFQKDIRRYYPFDIIECPDEATPDHASEVQEAEIRRIEGNRILQKIKEDDYVIALCIDGKHYSSEDWKKHINQIMPSIRGKLVLVIGGSLGLSDEVIRRSNEKLSFSSMTFPHQMMRMILCEQIVSCLVP